MTWDSCFNWFLSFNFIIYFYSYIEDRDREMEGENISFVDSLSQGL